MTAYRSALIVLGTLLSAQSIAIADQTWHHLREINPPAEGQATTVILGATLIDGRGGDGIPDSAVVVTDGQITSVGRRSDIKVPSEAKRVDASGMFLLPGLLDAHFHTNNPARVTRLLAGGFTAFRDPGRPMPVYERLLDPNRPMPRAFLTGPHFDQRPHAYPKNAADLQTEEAVRELVRRLYAEGASAIKVYFRLPLELIRTTCAQADELGIPVTAHLELVRADEAIRAGLDGIEHVTSLGTALANEQDAQEFEAGVRADNSYRRDGRYRLWSRLSFEDNPKVDELLGLMLDHGVYLTPTLRPFEVQPDDEDATQEKLVGFAKMQEFTAIAAKAGVPIVASSHGPTPEANWRELELLVESGLTPSAVISTATRVAAHFFGAQDRLGTIEPGKMADLVLLADNPLRDISAVRRVSRVMLNGVWFELEF